MEDSGILCKIRKIIWPIEKKEYAKVLPMAGMMLCILFNYAMLRSIKDGFVVVKIGAEAISFLKTYFVLPSSLLFMVLYTFLCDRMNSQKVFYTIITGFLVYLIIFTFFLYPNADLVSTDPGNIVALSSQYPHLKWFIKIIGNWSPVSFYIMAELWGSVGLSLLFWQFANQITLTDEAKRFYPTFGIIGNIGLPLTGLVLGYFLSENSIVSRDYKFIPVLSFTIVSYCIIMLLYRWVNANVVKNMELKQKKRKTKASLVDSFKVIFSSPYLGLLALLVFSYGVSINLVEGVWKAKMKELYPTSESYTHYMGEFQIWQGIFAIIFMIIGGNILRRVSWKSAAIFTPMMILVTGLCFFALILFQDQISFGWFSSFVAVQPLVIIVFLGSAQNILSKATKYSLFDGTKEMAYIPLSQDLKSKGKAAVDVIGGRLGKSGGAVIQSTFFIIFHTFTFIDAIPYFAVIFFIVVLGWIFAVNALSKRYYVALKESETQSEK